MTYTGEETSNMQRETKMLCATEAICTNGVHIEALGEGEDYA